MKKLAIYLSMILTFVGSSCDLNQLDNPNNLSVSQSDPNFVLNSIQLGVRDFFKDASEYGMYNTRILPLTTGSTYQSAYQPTSFDNIWISAYSTVLVNAKNLIAQADEQNLYMHAGIARVLQSYTLLMLVDLFGDVPFSQALDPNNLNPAVDKGSDVYSKALVALNTALENFDKVDSSTPTVAQDLYYGGKTQKWIALANTLKLKIYLQTRLIDNNAGDEIKALLTDADIIDEADGSEDFEFKFPANSISAPDTRNPWFTENYLNGANEYMSNQYMNTMLSDNDPRLRYYFYRQIDEEVTDVNAVPCVNQTKPAWYSNSDAFCQLGNGYIGRDHLNNDGTPPDTKLRTIYGIYPAGGKFDADNGVPGSINAGAKGQGIYPFMLASYVYFMRAEAALTIGTNEDAEQLLESGIRASMTKVASFGPLDVDWNPDVENDFAMTDAEVDDYVDNVLNEYEAATDKLDVVIREYWLALFGNGIEAYNTYRRTGKPSDMQPPKKVSDAGPYYRSLIYPSVFINRNSSQAQKPDDQQVFWDTNPQGFIK
jgi:hypothetical protein